MRLHPRYRRYLRQSLAFGLIWLAFSFVYVFIEAGLLGSLDTYPSTGNKYSFETSLIYTCIGGFLMGFVQGWIEVTWLKKQLTKYPFWLKFLLKSLFYLLLLITFLASLTLLINAQRFGASVFDPLVIDSLWQFISRFAFWSVIIYAGTALEVALFYSEMSEYIGEGVLYNYSFGKYHSPKEETRIFMFLDMKSSTTIAEKMGHRKYFDLISACYSDMTDPILECSGEIYQYVGDEIVISWPEREGKYDNNCIKCLVKIYEIFRKRKEYYQKNFGLVPEFKAGFHIGRVTTGEIGKIKKDIIYTGDVLNTTARIQAQCNTYDTKALISGSLLDQLKKEPHLTYNKIGNLLLRGKTESIELFSITFGID
ncbi:MAG: adenylate/guanylate cyclase domain-containing protein [Flavobacteriaceae bacterium]